MGWDECDLADETGDSLRVAIREKKLERKNI